MPFQVIDEPRGFAASLGQNLGKGIGEQLPKTVEKYGLGKSLQDLEEQGAVPKGSAKIAFRGGIPAFEKLSPYLNRAAYLQRGFEPSGAATKQDASKFSASSQQETPLQQEKPSSRQRQALSMQEKSLEGQQQKEQPREQSLQPQALGMQFGIPKQRPVSKGATQPEIATQGQAAPQQEGVSTSQASIPQNEAYGMQWKSPQEIERFKANLTKEPSNEEIRAKAVEMAQRGEIRENPKDDAFKEIKKDQAAYAENENVLTTDLKDRLNRIFQSGGLEDYSTITGPMRDKLIEQGKAELKNKTPQQVSNDLVNTAIKMHHDLLQFKTKASENFASGDKIKQARNLVMQFDKAGMGKEFDDFATSVLGVDPQNYAYNTYGIDNPKVEAKIKRLNQKSTMIKDSQAAKDVIKSIADVIDEDDNINAIQYAILKKGMNPAPLKDVLDVKTAKNPKALNDEQRMQLSKPAPRRISFTDLLFDGSL